MGRYRWARRHGALLRDGMILKVLNPKTALFFLAYLPWFVDVPTARDLVSAQP